MIELSTVSWEELRNSLLMRDDPSVKDKCLSMDEVNGLPEFTWQGMIFRQLPAEKNELKEVLDGGEVDDLIAEPALDLAKPAPYLRWARGRIAWLRGELDRVRGQRDSAQKELSAAKSQLTDQDEAIRGLERWKLRRDKLVQTLPVNAVVRHSLTDVELGRVVAVKVDRGGTWYKVRTWTLQSNACWMPVEHWVHADEVGPDTDVLPLTWEVDARA